MFFMCVFSFVVVVFSNWFTCYVYMLFFFVNNIIFLFSFCTTYMSWNLLIIPTKTNCLQFSDIFFYRPRSIWWRPPVSPLRGFFSIFSYSSRKILTIKNLFLISSCLQLLSIITACKLLISALFSNKIIVLISCCMFSKTFIIFALSI